MRQTEEENHLEQTFLDELNYKIWSTKESRFNAHQRLLKRSKRSHLCQRILFVYFLFLTLIAIYNLILNPSYDKNVLIISIVSFSLLLVLFGRIENSKAYHEKAKEFYTCGVELASLHNVLIIFKSLIENQSVESKTEFADKIALSYQRIVELHQSHEFIDTELFKCKASVYHNLNWFEVQKIKLTYYYKTALLYHVLIIVPPLLLFILLKN